MCLQNKLESEFSKKKSSSLIPLINVQACDAEMKKEELKVTMRNFSVFMKQSHDSSDDDKFLVPANETLSEKTAVLLLMCYY